MRIMEQAYGLLVTPIKRVAAANIPVPPGHLERWVLPKPQAIANAVGSVMGIDEQLAVTARAPGPGSTVV